MHDDPTPHAAPAVQPPHPRGPQFVHTSDNPVRALCCECGTVRVTTPGGLGHMADRGWSRGRCLVRRRCVTCAQVTKHAYLRDNDDAADFAEMLDSAGAALDRGTELLEEVAWLRTCDVIVTFEDPSQFEAGEAVVIWQLLNDGGHVLWLNSGHPAGQLLDGLQYVCGQLAGGILDDPCTPWRVWVGCDEAPPVRRLGFGMEGGG